jgi:hypothetical protein
MTSDFTQHTRIRLKSLSINTAMSEETIAFTATVYFDGVKIGHASNRGTGGATNFDRLYYEFESIREAQDRKIKEANEWARTLSIPTPKAFIDSLGPELRMDGLEDWIDALVAEEDDIRKAKRQLKRLLARMIVVVDGDVAKTLKTTWDVRKRDQVLKQIPNAVILNELPFSEALERFRKVTQ